MTRSDALPKAMGAVPYAGDLELPGMLWAAYVTSPHAHARIRLLDPSPARKVPGVVDVLTAEDLPALLPDGFVEDPPLLAAEEVRFVGQPVAVVAAETLPAARQGARAVRVEYEPLPSFTDIESEFPRWPDREEMKGNPHVTGHVLARRGDFEAVAARGDLVHEETYRTGMVAQVALEPHACLAEVRGSDWHVITTTQTPFGIREDLADKLHLPAEHLRVEGTWVGGGFGGKNEAILEPHALLLAKKTGRPVRIGLSFREEFLWARSTQPAVFRMTSVVIDGRLVARRTRLLLDTGNSLPGRDFALGYSLGFTLGPYRLEAWEVEGYALRTHRPPFGPHRAPLAPQCAFAAEGHIDSLARRMGVDPVEFRRRHVWREGDLTPFGQKVPPFAAEAALREAQERIRSWRPQLPPHHGLGVAVGYWSTGTTAGGEADLFLGPGGLTVRQGEREIGNGTVVSGLVSVASQATGLPAEHITVDYHDTSRAPYDSGVWGSRTLSTLGFAVDKAARAILEELARRFHPPLPPRTEVRLAWEGGEVRVEGGGRSQPLLELLTPEERKDGGILRRGKHYGKGGSLDESVVVEGALYPYSDLTASVHLAHVAVDPETGAVQVIRYAAWQDAGKVFDVDGYRGQVEGGVVMGFGTALTEEGLLGPDGRLRNPGLLDYRIPTLAEVPPLEIVALEGFPGSGVGGAKGVGEPPIIPVPAAVANAVADATGHRVRELPLTPERVARALGLLGPPEGAPSEPERSRTP